MEEKEQTLEEKIDGLLYKEDEEVEEKPEKVNVVDAIVDTIKRMGIAFKPDYVKRKEKLQRLKEQYDMIEDTDYRKEQLGYKISILEKKVNPSWIWTTDKGTYTLSTEEKEAKIAKSSKRRKRVERNAN